MMTVSPVLDRTPPQSVELEMCVLGGILLEPKDAYPVAADILCPEDFYLDGHALTFRLMGELYSRGIPPDATSVIDELRARNLLDEVGGSGVVLGMLNSVPTGANVEYHARKVAEKARLRGLILACSRIIEDCFDQQENPDEILARAEKRLADLSDSGRPDEVIWLSDHLRHEWERLGARSEAVEQARAAGKPIPLTGIPTGLPDLDKATGGLEDETLTIIAARPSVGKSALGQQIAEHAAAAGHRSLIISLEMSETQLCHRTLAAGTRQAGRVIDTTRIKAQTDLDREDWRALTTSYMRATQLPLALLYPGGQLQQVRATIRRMVRKYHVRLAMIDYLQLMSNPAVKDSRVREIGSITEALKALTRELKIPIVLLSQLRRPDPNSKPRRPRLEDLRESGSIEQDADVVIFIHREGDHWPLANGGSLPQGELIIAKNRNGPTGPTRVLYDAEITRFLPMEAHHG